ncbi:hypothetical protein IKT18_01825 [Candidatus Saccharibacteria bacterium]|nr:hypothetical protein [Candidatus Saccharibacteria bacterium]
MSSKLLINVNDANPVVVPDTDADTNAPDTGMLSVSHNDGVNNTSNMIAPIVGISVLLVVLVALIISLVRKQKSKKTNNFSIYSRRHTILRITSIMTLILITTFVALNFNTKQEDNVNAASNTLTITASDIEIDVDLKDKAVFATGESVVTVDSATTAGYTLMAYVDSTTTDLTNETDKSSKSTISMLDSTYSKALEDNTWGMAITKPTSQDDTLFRGLPTAEKYAMTIKATSDATSANDKSTFYYATYITPDLDFGTYSGATITYIAIANVVEDDVTVNYHMPDDVEHIFPEKSGDTRFLDGYINTVTYNKTSGLAYIGDNCGKLYTTAEPNAIVKTSNLNNNGVQNGMYEPIMEPVMLNGGNVYVIAYQVVNVPGADGIKIDIDYRITEAYIAVFKGEWAIDEILDESSPLGIGAAALAESQMIMPTESPLMEGDAEYVFDGDTVTVAAIVLDGPQEGYDYGFFAEVFPIYAEQPEDVGAIEKTTCYSEKSSEVSSRWNKFDRMYFHQILIPGAKKMKMEIDYELDSGLQLYVAEGNFGPIGIELGMIYGGEMVVPGFVLQAFDETISGSTEIYLDSGIVSFMVSDRGSLAEDRVFEFNIKLYPVYDEEHEGTVPVETSTVARKVGNYGESVGHAMWRYYYGIDDYDRYYLPLFDERSVELFVDFYYDDFAGQTIDVVERSAMVPIHADS